MQTQDLCLACQLAKQVGFRQNIFFSNTILRRTVVVRALWIWIYKNLTVRMQRLSAYLKF